DARGNLDANPNVTTCTPPAAGCADRGDVGDPFPGVTQNHTLALFTMPNTALNSGACPGVGIDSITQVVPNDVMRFFLRLGGDSLAVVTAPQLAPAQWGYSYTAALAAACGAGSYTWAVDSGTPPPQVLLSPSLGSLSGAPSDTGTFTFKVRVTDGAQTARGTLTLQVTEPTLTLQQVLDLGFQGPAPESDDRRRYLDLQGNRDGTFDIGDVARWLARTGNNAAPGAPARAPGRRPCPGAAGCPASCSPSRGAAAGAPRDRRPPVPRCGCRMRARATGRCVSRSRARAGRPASPRA